KVGDVPGEALGMTLVRVFKGAVRFALPLPVDHPETEVALEQIACQLEIFLGKFAHTLQPDHHGIRDMAFRRDGAEADHPPLRVFEGMPAPSRRHQEALFKVRLCVPVGTHSRYPIGEAMEAPASALI